MLVRMLGKASPFAYGTLTILQLSGWQKIASVVRLFQA
jgi:hypothetical protein